jgi:uncharacterized protein (TIGR02145 family)
MNLLKDLKYLFILLICASCADEEQRNNMQETNEVNFSVSVADLITSRATNDVWDAGDEVGIYMVPAMATATDTADFSTYSPESVNVPYRVPTAGTSVDLVAVSNAILYPTDGSNVNFVAYYPYSNDEDTVTSAGVYKADVGIQLYPENIDLLYHKGNVDYNHRSSSVSLNFKHKLSKLIINLTPASGVKANLSTVSASLSGFPTKADFNLSTGTFGAPSTVADLTPVTITATAAKYTCEVIIVPNEDLTGRVITFTLGSATYTYKFLSSSSFVSGEQYTYDLTLTGSDVVLANVTIDNWGAGTSDYTFNVSRTKFELIGHKTYDNAVNVLTNSPSPIAIADATTSLNKNGTGGTVSWITLDNTNYTSGELTFNTAANLTKAKRTGYIQMTVNGTTVVITVIQDYVNTGSNSYIVAPGSAGITFPINRAIYYGNAADDATFTAFVLWEDNDDVITYEMLKVSGRGVDATLTVVPDAVKEGNAVIAVIDSNETIYWSYHIWVTGYDPDATGANFSEPTETGFVFMDRNLGAKTPDLGYGIGKGLFYQWGRKDPFPATGSVYAVASDDSVGTIDYAIQHPDEFIKNGSGNWLYTNDNTLWGHNSTKTAYDPCPEGWRVPSFVGGTIANYSPWKGYTKDNGTWTAGEGYYTFAGDDNANYPAAGYRYSSDGALQFRGQVGNYWSASPYSNYPQGLSLNFNDSSVAIAGTGTYKSAGLSVRCVKE